MADYNFCQVGGVVEPSEDDFIEGGENIGELPDSDDGDYEIGDPETGEGEYM